MKKLGYYLDFLMQACVRPRMWRHPVDYLFLLSHMRSRSTLLAHILGSHPEIAGYREFLRPYRSIYGFMRLRYWTLKELSWSHPRYLQDKILHKSYTPEAEIFARFQVRSILFIREPIGTLKSIVRMGQKAGEPNHQNPTWAAQYYRDRTQELVALAEALPKQSWIYFDSDELINTPQSLLGRIQSFLNLRSPLSTEYQKFDGTGIGGLGDPSKHIHAGKILNLDKDRNADIQLEASLVNEATAIYQEVSEALRNHSGQFQGITSTAASEKTEF